MLSLERVSKSFGAIRAVDDATVEIAAGRITAIVGENGAGKSTLLKMGAGVLSPDEGTVKIRGEALAPATPARAAALSIGMVHQHFMLVHCFTALENIVLGGEPVRSGGRLDLARARRDASEMMKRTGLEVPLDAITEELTVGERQKLEILRVLVRGARVLLLDEPTAVLSPLEADELYGVLRNLADEGRAVAVVTHRLDEVVRFADVAVVMRKGRIVQPEQGSSPLREDALTRAIMGAEPAVASAHTDVRDDADIVLDARDLRLVIDQKTVLDGVGLALREGEIVGIAGVEGNGQRELVRVISGLEQRATGTLEIGGQSVMGLGAAARRRLLASVYEDRHVEGLVLPASVGDNLILGELDSPAFDEPEVIKRRLERFAIAPPRPDLPAASLSGGNQQKIVVARAFDRVAGHGRVMVLSQPTRGVDVGAAAVIHEAILEAARSGFGVVLSSADLSELRRLSHRIVVIHKGRIVAEHPPTASDREIGRTMLGLEAA